MPLRTSPPNEQELIRKARERALFLRAVQRKQDSVKRWRIMFIMLVFCLVLGMTIASVAHGQEVNQWFSVQPGTLLSVTQNGQVIYQKTVAPGRVHVQITYEASPTVGARPKPSRRRR